MTSSATKVVLFLVTMALIVGFQASAPSPAFAAPDAPVLVNPIEGERLTSPLSAATGTGTPGAVIHARGSTLQDVTVDAGGNFIIGFLPPLFFGVHSLTLTQEVDGEISVPLTTNFSVVPPPPTLTTPPPGIEIPVSETPLTLSGMAVGGATIRVSIDGVEQPNQPQANQGWSVTLADPLSAGPHSIVITQEISGAVSDPLIVSLVVRAPDVAPPAAPDGPIAPTAPTAPDAPTLPETGTATQEPFWLALGLVAAGCAIAARRRARNAS